MHALNTHHDLSVDRPCSSPMIRGFICIRAAPAQIWIDHHSTPYLISWTTIRIKTWYLEAPKTLTEHLHAQEKKKYVKTETFLYFDSISTRYRRENPKTPTSQHKIRSEKHTTWRSSLWIGTGTTILLCCAAVIIIIVETVSRNGWRRYYTQFNNRFRGHEQYVHNRKRSGIRTVSRGRIKFRE